MTAHHGDPSIAFTVMRRLGGPFRVWGSWPEVCAHSLFEKTESAVDEKATLPEVFSI
jgi:hypothetical protein